MASATLTPRDDVHAWLRDLGDGDAEHFVATMGDDGLRQLLSEFDAALATYPPGSDFKDRAKELYGQASAKLDIRSFDELSSG